MCWDSGPLNRTVCVRDPSIRFIRQRLPCDVATGSLWNRRTGLSRSRALVDQWFIGFQGYVKTDRPAWLCSEIRFPHYSRCD